MIALKFTILWEWSVVRVFTLVSLPPASHCSNLSCGYMPSILKSLCLSVGLLHQRLEWLQSQSSTSIQQLLRHQSSPRCLPSPLVFPFVTPGQLPPIPLAPKDTDDFCIFCSQLPPKFQTYLTITKNITEYLLYSTSMSNLTCAHQLCHVFSETPPLFKEQPSIM